MATAEIQWREPESFVSGDTLLFQRNLPAYLPSDGWAIRLTVSQPLPQGAQIVAQVTSAPDSTNNYHCFNSANFCGGVPAGSYILSEEVFKQSTGEQHQIHYDSDFQITDDLDAGLSGGVVLSEAQRMLSALYDTYNQLMRLKFAETEDMRSRFRIQDQSKVLQDIKYWKSVRILELQQERARNGQPTGASPEAFFCIG